MLGPWSRLALVPTIIPALEGVEATLRAGGSLADVGCGAGVAAIAMAQAFPTAEVHGYDPSHHAVNRARESAERAGVKNLTFHTEPGEDLPEGAGFDLVTTLDVLHDLPHPGRVLRAIRRAMADDGTLLVKETRCRPAFEDNLHNPFLPMLYGFSVSACMSSALSEPDGAGLGTVGLPRERLEDMADAAGFSGLAEHDFGDPANLYYEVRA
jgi:SAM-dependent methyltransferase